MVDVTMGKLTRSGVTVRNSVTAPKRVDVNYRGGGKNVVYLGKSCCVECRVFGTLIPRPGGLKLLSSPLHLFWGQN